jgi:hypothetical protein
LPIPCLGLYPLLLPLALLGLEYNTLSMTNPVCHKPLVKTHGTALGISWGRTGKRTITAVNSLAGNLGKWNITGWHINGAIHQPVLLFLLSLDIYSPLGLQIVHYGITCLAHITTLLLVLTPHSIHPPIHLSVQINPSTRGTAHKSLNLLLLDPLLLPCRHGNVKLGWPPLYLLMCLLQCLLSSNGHQDNGFTPLPIPPGSTTLLAITPHLVNRPNMNHDTNIWPINA